MKYQTIEEKFEKSPVERYQDKTTKLWNLRKKDDGSFISEIWFDILGTWSKYCVNEYDIFGWDGVVLLNPPIKINGVYPYFVNGDFYKYSSEGEFLECNKNGYAGMWGTNYTRIY